VTAALVTGDSVTLALVILPLVTTAPVTGDFVTGDSVTLALVSTAPATGALLESAPGTPALCPPGTLVTAVLVTAVPATAVLVTAVLVTAVLAPGVPGGQARTGAPPRPHSEKSPSTVAPPLLPAAVLEQVEEDSCRVFSTVELNLADVSRHLWTVGSQRCQPGTGKRGKFLEVAPYCASVSQKLVQLWSQRHTPYPCHCSALCARHPASLWRAP